MTKKHFTLLGVLIASTLALYLLIAYQLFGHKTSPPQKIKEAPMIGQQEEKSILATASDSQRRKTVFLYIMPDGQMKLDLKTPEGTNTIKNFFAEPGRSKTPEDEVSLSFSPDDALILVTNTLTVGNPQDKNTVWVIDPTGKEIVSLQASGSAWPKEAMWDGAEKITYKFGKTRKTKIVSISP